MAVVNLSEHPIDQDIREIIQTRRMATTHEVEQITERMAAAPFEPRDERVRVIHYGIEYLGVRLGHRESSLLYHLVRRVVVEKQWAHGTTESDYLEDLRTAVRDQTAHLAVYRRRGGNIAVLSTFTENAVPVARQGDWALPYLLAVYSADRGIIVTGYQVSSMEAASIPEAALWLK